MDAVGATDLLRTGIANFSASNQPEQYPRANLDAGNFRHGNDLRTADRRDRFKYRSRGGIIRHGRGVSVRQPGLSGADSADCWAGHSDVDGVNQWDCQYAVSYSDVYGNAGDLIRRWRLEHLRQ